MAISDKITQLDTNIKALKSYLPKMTTNENTLENSLPLYLLKNEINGNSYQETRSGKNLYGLTGSTTNNGITYTYNNDGSYDITGTATGQANIYVYFDYTKSKLVSEQQYTLSYNLNLPSNCNIRVENYNGENTWVSNLFVADSSINSTKKITNTITLNGNKIRFGFRVYQGQTINLKGLKIQLEQGSTATNWEQYGASPSPDYPSEIKSVEGIRNLYLLPDNETKNGITFTKNSDGTFNITGTATANTSFLSLLDLSLIENNKLYTLSSNYAVTGLEYRFEEYNNTTWVKQYTKIGNSTTSKSSSVTISKSTGNKVRLCIYIYSGTTLNLQNVEIQLQNGNQTTFVPYGNWLVEKIIGKNLFDKNATLTRGYLYNDNTYADSANYIITDFMPVTPNTEYTISDITNTGSNPSYCFYDKDKNFISGTRHNGYVHKKTITTPNNAYYMRDSINTLDIDLYQLEKGNVATDYTPYQEETILVNLNKENLFDKENVVNAKLTPNSTTVGETTTFYQPTKLTAFILDVKEYDNIVVKKELSKTFRIAGSSDYPSVNSSCKVLYFNDTGTEAIINVKNFNYITVVYYSTDDTLSQSKILDSIKIFKGTEPFDCYEFNKIGDVKDEIDLTTGVLTKRIGKVDLSKLKIAQETTAQSKRYRFEGIENLVKRPINNSQIMNLVSDIYIKNSATWSWNATIGKGIATQTNGQIIVFDENYKLASDLTNFTNMINEKKPKLYYELAEPQVIQLESHKIKAFDGTTNIEILSEVQPTLETTYYVDGRKYIPSATVLSLDEEDEVENEQD